jgi:hypothetical protein
MATAETLVLARRLLRAADTAALGTLAAGDGSPYASG